MVESVVASDRSPVEVVDVVAELLLQTGGGQYLVPARLARSSDQPVLGGERHRLEGPIDFLG
ncbi:hypothetical protein VB773_14595 [Haloarculaceae archaeon H-GB2-1]|nr:hypothetical protein [Haloarculaceae archaeon H-GB1-1]MEA5408675.1 hypothetical protein [Haloarculaceae archaeon H-GB2-1]